MSVFSFPETFSVERVRGADAPGGLTPLSPICVNLCFICGCLSALSLFPGVADSLSWDSRLPRCRCRNGQKCGRRFWLRLSDGCSAHSDFDNLRSGDAAENALFRV